MPARVTRSTSSSAPVPVAVAESTPFAATSTEAPPAPLTTPPSGYRGLKVWQRAMDLAVAVYRATQDFGDDTLRTELWRSAIAIPGHIAAGNSMYERPAYVAQLSQAHGEVGRLESLLAFAESIGAITVGDSAALTTDAGNVGRMLRGLVRALQPTEKVEEATVN